jgi:hypothetical protein
MSPVKRVIMVAVSAVGVVLVAFGLFLVGAYAVGIIEIFVEKPADRSWLFWGAGLAVFGVMLASAGVGLILAARSWRRRSRVERGPSAAETPD